MQDKVRRREFLAAGAALLGAVTGGSPKAAAFSTTTWQSQLPLKKAVKFGMVEEDLSVLDKFKLLRDLGFDGVEMKSPNELDNDEVIRARDQSGLPIHGVVDSVHWSKPLSDPDPGVRGEGLDALKTALRDANTYGADSVLLVPAVVTETVSYDDAYSRSQAEIRKVLPMAEELGVRIIFENVGNRFLMSPLEFARYVDDFNSDWIGVYFDIGNVIRYGWPEQWIRILDHRIIKLDVKDRRRRRLPGEEEGPKIGDGDVDWAAVRQAIIDIGFEGWATAEVLGGDRTRLADIAQRMDRFLLNA